MRTRKAQTQSEADPPRCEALRKIAPTDRFPCFACFDNPRDKLTCPECAGNGWVSGSHPMVQFAEDFIEKRLSGLTANDMANSNTHHSEIGEIPVRMSGSYDPQKKRKDVLPVVSAKTVVMGDEIRETRRSEVEEAAQRQQYFCDDCVTKDPIKGKRFHCKQCEDFDLCESCFSRGVHGEHEFKEFAPLSKPDSETIVAQIKGTLLKKSIRYNK